MSRKEFELDLDDKQMKNILKKAKRKHLLRNWLISIISTIIVIFVTLFVVFNLVQKNNKKMDSEVVALQTVRGPNMNFYGHTKMSTGFTGGTVIYNSYKNIEGQPIKWVDEIYEYSIWGYHQINTNGNVVLDTEQKSQGDSTQPDYNIQTMQREMRFYLPFVSYANYVNNLKDIGKFQNKVAEVAISFDKSYSVEQIIQMLPKDVNPVWFWVDTYNKKKPEIYNGLKSKDGTVLNAQMSTDVFGFKGSYTNNEEQSKIDLQRNSKAFLQAMKFLSSEGYFKNTVEDSYKNIKDISPKNLPIYGVVITGTTQSLQKLQGQSFIKAAVRGVTVEKQ
jgi:hypothetical protein